MKLYEVKYQAQRRCCGRKGGGSWIWRIVRVRAETPEQAEAEFRKGNPKALVEYVREITTLGR